MERAGRIYIRPLCNSGVGITPVFDFPRYKMVLFPAQGATVAQSVLQMVAAATLEMKALRDCQLQACLQRQNTDIRDKIYDTLYEWLLRRLLIPNTARILRS